MSRIDSWFAESPRRAAAEYACELVRRPLWRKDETRFVRTVPDVEELAEPFLAVEVELAHALLLVLEQLPRGARRPFADEFYARRGRDGAAWAPSSEQARLRAGAGIALLVVDLAEAPELRNERLLDLLAGAAQGDDVSAAPPAAVAAVAAAVARARTDPALADELEPAGAAAHAVAEVLDPSSGIVAVQEVAVRAAWAAVRSWEPARVLELLLAIDAVFAGAADD